MSILSIEYVGFVILTVILYYIIPLKFRWLVLLAASCVFYALAGWQGCIWLVAVAAFSFIASKCQAKLLKRELAIESALKNNIAEGLEEEQQINKAKLKKSAVLRKVFLAISLILPFVAMAATKYIDILRLWIKSLPVEGWIIPLGLSYFTFQAAGYMVDVYRGKIEDEKNPLKYLLFVSFFPQMIQGPISTYQQLQPQLINGNRFNPDNFVMGLQIALWGFFKKMVIADRLAYTVDHVNNAQPGWYILVYAIMYIIRLYADFSGGIDVIRGAAKMLGVDLPENFKRPFFSHSVAEYWRRWHITLGTWFKNYLFYPFTTSGVGIALSKFGKKVFGKKAGRALPAAISTVIVFFIIGIWHVANWNAVIFGVYFGLVMGIAIMLEPAFKKLKKKCKVNEKSIPWKIFTMVRTWVLILIPQYFAFTALPETGCSLFVNTFKNWTFNNSGELFTESMDALEWYIVIAAFIIMLLVDILCERVNDLNGKLAKTTIAIRWPIIIILILAILIFGCYGAGFDPTAFLYTNF